MPDFDLAKAQKLVNDLRGIAARYRDLSGNIIGAMNAQTMREAADALQAAIDAQKKQPCGVNKWDADFGSILWCQYTKPCPVHDAQQRENRSDDA